MNQLLKEITECSFIQDAREGKDTPCKRIINTQGLDEFHLPEPWNGDLENCKILFISSNPSINSDEKYPLNSWNSEDIRDFFINRFSHDHVWVKKELYPLHKKDGNYSKSWVRFWAAVRSSAKMN